MLVAIVDFAAVTLVTVLAIAWVFIRSGYVQQTQNGLVTGLTDSVRAIKPILGVYATYAVWKLGFSISGLVSGLETLINVLP